MNIDDFSNQLPAGAPMPQAITIYGSMSDPSFTTMTEYSVLSIPAFWCGVRFISETLASLPKQIYRKVGESRQPAEHPLNRLLSRKVNSFGTIPFTLFETLHSHAVIFGNGYAWVERDPKTSKPIGLHTLNPQSVTPFRYQGSQFYFVRGLGNAATILHSADCIHLAGLGFDGMCGYPVVFLLAEALDLALNGQKFASRYFKRGSQVAGSIECPAQATKEQVDAIVDRVKRNHSGMESDYSLMVLVNGAKLNNDTIPPEQSQLLESRQFSVIDMCRILRVPPHVLFELSKSSWSNIESMSQELVKFSLRAWIEKAEQEISGKILTDAELDAGYEVRYSVAALIRGDTESQTKQVTSLVSMGIITGNEGRALLDLPPIDDPAATQLRIPVNFPISVPTNTTTTNTPATTPQTPDTSASDFSTYAPIIEDVIARVETKTTKAFSNREGKPDQDKVVWANVFAEQQAAYVSESLAPVAAVIKTTTGKALDVAKIGERYGASLRAKAAGASHKTLAEIIGDENE